jgi:hypothetical protein
MTWFGGRSGERQHGDDPLHRACRRAQFAVRLTVKAGLGGAGS